MFQVFVSHCVLHWIKIPLRNYQSLFLLLGFQLHYHLSLYCKLMWFLYFGSVNINFTSANSPDWKVNGLAVCWISIYANPRNNKLFGAEVRDIARNAFDICEKKIGHSSYFMILIVCIICSMSLCPLQQKTWLSGAAFSRVRGENWRMLTTAIIGIESWVFELSKNWDSNKNKTKLHCCC